MEDVEDKVPILSSFLEYSQYYRCNFRGYFGIQFFFFTYTCSSRKVCEHLMSQKYLKSEKYLKS